MKRKNLFAAAIAALMLVIFSANAAPVCAATNTIHSINMDVYIDASGTANVTEVWDVSISEGTEGYKPYGNLGDCAIKDFTVSDDTGVVYDTLPKWDTSLSFSAKAHKCGLNKTSDGVELCWGISEYGGRTYTLKYKITNFVKQYSDSQGVYFGLIPDQMRQTCEHVTVTLTAGEPLDASNAKIWAFGYTGDIVFNDGAVVMDSGGVLPSSSYMVALIQFGGNYFTTTSKVNKAFSQIYDEAMQGADKNESSSGSSGKRSVLSYILFGPEIIFYILFAFGVPVFAVYRSRSASNKRKRTATRYDFGPEGNTVPSLKEVDYWHEVPCNKDLALAYFVMRNFSISHTKDGLKTKSDLIGAVILKWLAEKKVSVTEYAGGLFGIGKGYSVDFRGVVTGGSDAPEARLMTAFKTAAGSNEILEPKEFEKWCKKNYSSIQYWPDSMYNYAFEHLGELVTKAEEPTGHKNETRTVYTYSSKLREEAVKLQGLKKFLLDFSTMEQREAYEVHLWEEYLIFAQMLGIADEVRKEFSKVYPDFEKISSFGTDRGSFGTAATFALCASITHGYHTGVAAGQAKAARAARSSSGRGGSSHSGGGHSSSGHSSGGGFR